MLLMDRILASNQADLQVTFYAADGTATDATGLPTVTITRADGTAVVTGVNSTKVTPGTGIYKYTLSAAQTATLDVLKLVWSAVVAGANQTITTYTEVVGGFLFSVADARAVTALSNTTTYPTSAIVAARTLAEDAFEHAAGRAFVPRYARETLDGTGLTTLGLEWPYVQLIRDVTVDGTALTVSELADLSWHPSRGLYREAGWDVGYANIVIGYQHGMAYPPPRVSGAVLTLAKTRLVKGPVDDRATQIATDAGGTISLLTPGDRGSVFGIPEVDATLQDYRLATVVG